MADSGGSGQTLRRAFGAAAAKMSRDFEVTSSTTTCWFAQAGVGNLTVPSYSTDRDELEKNLGPRLLGLVNSIEYKLGLQAS